MPVIESPEVKKEEENKVQAPAAEKEVDKTAEKSGKVHWGRGFTHGYRVTQMATYMSVVQYTYLTFGSH